MRILPKDIFDSLIKKALSKYDYDQPPGSTNMDLTYDEVLDYFETKKIRITREHLTANGLFQSHIWVFKEKLENGKDNNIGKWDRITFTRGYQNVYDALNERIKEAIELL